MGKACQDPRVETVCETIRQILGDKKRTQSEVELSVGWSKRYLSQLLNGHVRLTIHHLLLVADALAIEPRDLFFRVATSFEKAKTSEDKSGQPKFEELTKSKLDNQENHKRSLPRDPGKDAANGLKIFGKQVHLADSYEDQLLSELAALASHRDANEDPLPRTDSWISLPTCRSLLDRCDVLRRDDPNSYFRTAGAAVLVAEALPPQTRHQHHDIRAAAWAELGNSLRVRGELATARSAIDASRRASRKGTQNPLVAAQLLAVRASLARDLGELDDAIDLGLEAVQLYEDLGEDLKAARSQIGLAITYGEYLDWRSAFRHLVQAMDRPALQDDKAMALVAIHNFASFVSEAGNPHQALRAARTVAPFYGYFPGGSVLRVRLIWLEGAAYRRLHRPAKAAQLFRQASDAFFHLGRGYDAALATLELASSLIDCGDFAGVARQAQSACRDLLRLGSTSGALAAITVLKNACEASAVTAELVTELQRRLEAERRDPLR